MLGSLGSFVTRQFFAVEDFGVTDLEKNIFRRTIVFALFLVFGFGPTPGAARSARKDIRFRDSTAQKLQFAFYAFRVRKTGATADAADAADPGHFLSGHSFSGK